MILVHYDHVETTLQVSTAVAPGLMASWESSTPFARRLHLLDIGEERRWGSYGLIIPTSKSSSKLKQLDYANSVQRLCRHH